MPPRTASPQHSSVDVTPVEEDGPAQDGAPTSLDSAERRSTRPIRAQSAASPSTDLSDDGLSAGLDLDLLDPDHLRVPPLHPVERLHRALKRPLQPRHRGRDIHRPTVRPTRAEA